MMGRRIVRRITLYLSVGLILLGCAPIAPVTSPPSAPRSEGIETVVVRTAAAAQTQTAILFPTATNTSTSTPLPTKTATITPTPTATIIFSFAPTAGSTEEFFGNDESSGSGGSNKGGGNNANPTKTPVIREWACQVLSRYPKEGTEFIGGTTFRAVWVVRNTGSKTWPKKGVDVVYQSGADLVDGKPYVDIPAAVGPGGTVQITLTMNAPKRSSDYSTRWTLMVGKTQFCSVRIAFNTK